MHRSMQFIGFVFVFLLFSCLIYDVGKMEIYKTEIKNALDLATKAAVLQIDTTPEKIGQGIIEINPVVSKEVFKEYLSENLNSSNHEIMVYVSDYEAINAHTPTTYVNPDTGVEYPINAPTFVAVLKYEYKGLLISKSVTLNNLSGSSLKVTHH